VHGFRNLITTVITVELGVTIVVMTATAVGAFAAGGGGDTAEVGSLSAYRAAQTVASSQAAQTTAQTAGTPIVVGTPTQAGG
jgi:hypothetical protein